MKNLAILTLIFTIGLTLGSGIPANAQSNSIYICAKTMRTDIPHVHTDDAHWQYRDGNWMCADEEYHQALYDTWIETNNKWYYVNKDGVLLTDTWINDTYTDTWYYVDENGVWQDQEQ